MRIFHAPLTILVARPTLLTEGVNRLLEEYGQEPSGWRRGADDTDADGLAELMGRLCYGSFGDLQGRVGADDYMAHILKSGHGSLLQHPNWSFVVCRASRGFTHQIVRHSVGFSYSQESQHFIRYDTEEAEPGAQEVAVCLTGVPQVLHDMFIDNHRDAVKRYAIAWHAMKKAEPTWKKKVICERTRGLLPTGVESRLGITANARALRHFCETRGNDENALEIRLVAAQIAAIMKVEAPAEFADLVIGYDLGDPWPTITTLRRKV